MGMIQCTKHGLGHIVHTCCHIDVAISEKKALEVFGFDDVLLTSKLWLCSECANSFILSVSDNKYDILVPVCAICFERWNV